MKKILVATDFSENAVNALTYGVGLAQAFQAELVVFHAFMLDAYTPDPTANMVMAESQQEVALKDMKDLETYIKQQFPGLKISTEIRAGSAMEETVYLADEIGADLIVVGLRGESNLSDRLFGSTAAGIIRDSHSAVLAVPQGYVFREPTDIIFACDYQNIHHKEIFKPFKEVVAQFNSKVLILNVVTEEEYARESAHTGISPLDYLEELPGSRTIAFNNEADTDEELAQYVKDHNADLLVMVPHRHGFFHRLFEGSHTKRMLIHAHIPVLCLPDRK